mmetsp:Transcript_38811/g.70004  ORF Transcript_38811/g.70004 Transcript_38811/m.70004 type:complete len:237 (-) Transcript_38811:2869-3579(-)
MCSMTKRYAVIKRRNVRQWQTSVQTHRTGLDHSKAKAIATARAPHATRTLTTISIPAVKRRCLVPRQARTSAMPLQASCSSRMQVDITVRPHNANRRMTRKHAAVKRARAKAQSAIQKRMCRRLTWKVCFVPVRFAMHRTPMMSMYAAVSVLFVPSKPVISEKATWCHGPNRRSSGAKGLSASLTWICHNAVTGRPHVRRWFAALDKDSRMQKIRAQNDAAGPFADFATGVSAVRS